MLTIQRVRGSEIERVEWEKNLVKSNEASGCADFGRNKILSGTLSLAVNSGFKQKAGWE